jgi:hypothetical protein
MDDGDAYLKFYYWMEAKKQGNAYWDGGNVQISVDGGEWTIIEPVNGYPANTIIGLQGAPGFGGETDGWIPAMFDIADYIGSDVQFRFQFGSTNNAENRGWFIDHFTIYGADLPGSGSGIANHFIDEIPDYFSLYQNYPNPFNPTTTIQFELPQRTNFTLRIYNVNGKLIKTLIDEFMEAGYHSVVWDGTDAAGKAVNSGLYIYHLESKDYSKTKSMILLK